MISRAIARHFVLDTGFASFIQQIVRYDEYK